MKRQVLLSATLAALLMCLAATAFAGGADAKETIEYFNKGTVQSVPGAYTYGGSKRDWIHAMASAPDGRIAVTGYTESSDGTLSDRTKTWRAGWVMMLDPQMNVMWNFCSRSGDLDHMRCPVFHEDGALTVIHETEGKQLKLITIDEHGERTKSRTLMSGKREDGMYYVEGVTDAGYLIASTENYGERVVYTLFDWDGGQIWQTKEFASISAVGGMHLIGRKENEQSFRLYRLSDTGAGPAQALAAVYEAGADGSVLRSYSDLISLEDGGAAACGSVWEGYRQGREEEKGLISRWDAQGRIVFEMYVMGNALQGLVKTEDGFAAMRIAKGEGENEIWELVRFDEKGVLCGTQKLLGTPSRDAGCAAVREDGTIICAQLAGLSGDEDVYLTVVGAK